MEKLQGTKIVLMEENLCMRLGEPLQMEDGMLIHVIKVRGTDEATQPISTVREQKGRGGNGQGRMAAGSVRAATAHAGFSF